MGVYSARPRNTTQLRFFDFYNQKKTKTRGYQQHQRRLVYIIHSIGERGSLSHVPVLEKYQIRLLKLFYWRSSEFINVHGQRNFFKSFPPQSLVAFSSRIDDHFALFHLHTLRNQQNYFTTLLDSKFQFLSKTSDLQLVQPTLLLLGIFSHNF